VDGAITSPPGCRVVLVEDDPTVLRVVADYLRARGFQVEPYADGTDASEALRAGTPDLVILDRILPGVTGDELCAQIRATSTVPVIMLTALDSVPARIGGLERGADDYIPKPFSLRELLLRMNGLLRRARGEAASLSAFRVGPFRVDPVVRSISREGRVIALTGREYELFVYLLKNPERVLSRREILTDVWGWSAGDASTVTVHVRRLRQKIEHDPADPQFLLTEWGAGYRFTVRGGT